MYFVYVLKSASTNKRYIGQTMNLNKRVADHNKGDSKYTKNRGPWMLVYSEEYKTRSQAILREKYLKTSAGRDYLDNFIK